MPKNKPLSVLVDTSFLISVYDESRSNHSTAKKYYKYFLKNSMTMYLSTIVISEFQQMQSIVDVLSTGHYITLPFNYDDSIKTADIAFNLGGTNRKNEPHAKYKDDLKIMAQAVANEIDFIITEDESTLARYAERLNNAGMFDPKVIIVKKGFDSSFFNGGQSTLIEEES